MPKVTIIFEDIEEPEADTGKGVAIEVQVEDTTEGSMSTAEAVASSAFNHAVELLNKAAAGEVGFEMIEESDPEGRQDLN